MARARQIVIPEVGDKKLADLQEAAEQYAEIRDERQALTAKEVTLKAELLRLMHRHKKTHYECEDVTVDIVHEDETVRVRIAKTKASENGDGEEIPF